MAAVPDPIELTRALIRRRSVTPADDGALDIVADALRPFGYRIERIRRGEVDNLFARRDKDGPCFAFAGHTDVVPPGPEADWSVDPFGAEMRDGRLVGRGSVDMKSGVAAFVTAACRLAEQDAPFDVALLVTGDEEGPSIDGTVAILDWMRSTEERIDACIVGEPTSKARLGDVVKVGRRGSLNARLRAVGRQGHVAYPHKALNPVPALVRFLDRVSSAKLDDGSERFDPSTLAVTSIDVGNPATNVIPGEARAMLNIRFNDQHRSDALEAWLRTEAAAAEREAGARIEVETKVTGEAFLTAPGPLTEAATASIEALTGRPPALETGGGTSDARFIKDVCPVVEIGLIGDGMHAVDEAVAVDDIPRLADLYVETALRWAALMR